MRSEPSGTHVASGGAGAGRGAPGEGAPRHDVPLPRGDRNANPSSIGLLALLAEDFRTHDRRLFEPGFLAIAVHRLGNARMDVRLRILRAPLTVAYRLLSALVAGLWGISLDYTTQVGRRVRLWHHGGMFLGARAIGDDVHIRHNTAFGIQNRGEKDGKPIIGNRVDVGVGACIVGPVTVGDDAVVGPNSVVVRHVPPGAVVMGVPARQAALTREAVPRESGRGEG